MALPVVSLTVTRSNCINGNARHRVTVSRPWPVARALERHHFRTDLPAAALADLVVGLHLTAYHLGSGPAAPDGFSPGRSPILRPRWLGVDALAGGPQTVGRWLGCVAFSDQPPGPGEDLGLPEGGSLCERFARFPVRGSDDELAGAWRDLLAAASGALAAVDWPKAYSAELAARIAREVGQ